MSTYKQLPAKDKAIQLINLFSFVCIECNFIENAVRSAIYCASEIRENCDPFESDYWSEVIENLKLRL